MRTALRSLTIILFAACSQLLACTLYSANTEHYPSSTIARGFKGDFFSLEPQPGANEVFVFRQRRLTIFPPVGSNSYLFIEISPSLLVGNSKLSVPTEGAST